MGGRRNQIYARGPTTRDGRPRRRAPGERLLPCPASRRGRRGGRRNRRRISRPRLRAPCRDGLGVRRETTRARAALQHGPREPRVTGRRPQARPHAVCDGLQHRSLERHGNESAPWMWRRPPLEVTSPGANAMPNKTSTKSTKVAKKAAAKRVAAKPKLLSGGNPQIAKGYGDAPVQAYIAAMPGWKRDVGRRLDAVIARTVPGVRKAVKWNSPFYGVNGEGWFLSFHCFAKYVKVAFFRGASLRPLPPDESKQKEVRYLDVHEDEELDEAQFAAWVKQASQLPGERM